MQGLDRKIGVCGFVLCGLLLVIAIAIGKGISISLTVGDKTLSILRTAASGSAVRPRCP